MKRKIHIKELDYWTKNKSDERKVSTTDVEFTKYLMAVFPDCLMERIDKDSKLTRYIIQYKTKISINQLIRQHQIIMQKLS